MGIVELYSQPLSCAILNVVLVTGVALCEVQARTSPPQAIWSTVHGYLAHKKTTTPLGSPNVIGPDA